MNCVICGNPEGRPWGSYGPTPACDACHSDWVSQHRAALDAKPTCLYRLYDASGRLLYAGITASIARRWKEHRTEHSGWWPQVTERRVVWYLERGHAWYAEREAVREELPLHNGEASAYAAGALLPLPPGIGPTPAPPTREEWWRDERAVAAYRLAWKAWLTLLREAELAEEDWLIL
ncbi:GIY-YIG nuclease family protein [Streptomyces sp. NPDC051133]|uniref:GIY-YIG nuclease family protein n=1 Tax=Streptomyces sp. NPDC051133 TaxID=3155521 RepID=UPI003431D487